MSNAHQKPRLLLADDEDDVREMVRRSLECIEGTVLSAFANPRTALDRCMEFLAEGPVIVVTDNLMGDNELTGVKLSEKLREFAASRGLSNRLAIIIFTSSLIEEDEHTADLVLLKPYKISQLREIVKQYVQKMSHLAHAA